MFAISGFKASLAAPNALPNPNPVIPETRPFLMSPVAAVVARPEPIALASAVFPASAGIIVGKKAEPNALPNNGAKKGKNASGCPVTGLVVSDPVGDKAAIPCTSTGFM